MTRPTIFIGILKGSNSAGGGGGGSSTYAAVVEVFSNRKPNGEFSIAELNKNKRQK
jgi:hypothetical protein